MRGFAEMTENGNSIKFSELNEEQVNTLVELFKVFGDLTRVRIMAFLFEQSEVCVGDIAQALNMTASAISHQLKILKSSRLIKSRRDGKQIYYSLADEHVFLILEKAIEHATE